ncbi:MAG: hypothetical protein ABR567_21445 [Myxococcales bacterium]|nr:hypothetical protein [Myxococcales bacterium]
MEPNDAERRAAALDALRTAEPAKSVTFWDRHGSKVILAVVLVVGIWVGTRLVGAFIRSSVDGTTRAQDDLRRGLRR